MGRTNEQGLASVLAKLGIHGKLTGAAEQAVRGLILRGLRLVPADDELVHPGDAGTAFIIVAGWAVREKVIEDGRRQKTALFLPGDVIDLGAFLLDEVDYSIMAVTDLHVAELSRRDVERLCELHPSLEHALQWEQLNQMAVKREWIVSIGQRSASERIAHLFCEVFVRLDAVGLTSGNACEFPLTQSDLGELTAMTTVHVNRVLQHLRGTGLVELGHHRLAIPDFDRMARYAMFDPGYLHLPGRKGSEPASSAVRGHAFPSAGGCSN